MRRIVFAVVAIGGGFISAAAINADPPVPPLKPIQIPEQKVQNDFSPYATNENLLWSHVRAQCEAAANEQAAYAPPVWKGVWASVFRQGTSLAIKRDISFINARSQWVPQTAYCYYNITTQSVISLKTELIR